MVADLAGQEDGQSPHKGGQLEGIVQGKQLLEGEYGGRSGRIRQLGAVGGQLGLAVVAGLGQGDGGDRQGVGDQLQHQHQQDEGKIRQKFVHAGKARVGEDIHDVVGHEFARRQKGKGQNDPLASLQSLLPDRVGRRGVTHGDHGHIQKAAVNEVVQDGGIDLVHMADVGSQLDVDGVEDQSLKGKSQPCDQQGDPKGIGGVFLFTQERHRNILSGLFRSYESSINQKHE